MQKRLCVACKKAGIGVTVFGLYVENARVFWNLQFLDHIPELPQTKAMLMWACDLRLPPRLTLDQVGEIGTMILETINGAASQKAI